MVKDRRFPNRRRAILGQNGLQSVRAESAQGYGQKAGGGGNPGGGSVRHHGIKSATGGLSAKFNNMCSFTGVRA